MSSKDSSQSFLDPFTKSIALKAWPHVCRQARVFQNSRCTLSGRKKGSFFQKQLTIIPRLIHRSEDMVRTGAGVPEQPVRAERERAGAAGGALHVRAQLQCARARRQRARVPPLRAPVSHHPRHPPLPPRRRLRAGPQLFIFKVEELRI